MELSPPVPPRWLYRLPLTGTTPALTWPDTVDSASLVAPPSSDGDSRILTTTWTIGCQHFSAGAHSAITMNYDDALSGSPVACFFNPTVPSQLIPGTGRPISRHHTPTLGAPHPVLKEICPFSG